MESAGSRGGSAGPAALGEPEDKRVWILSARNTAVILAAARHLETGMWLKPFWWFEEACG